MNGIFQNYIVTLAVKSLSLKKVSSFILQVPIEQNFNFQRFLFKDQNSSYSGLTKFMTLFLGV